ncbi:MAG: hypothetical protein O3A36_00300 [bacterium]|nr:hypothetical protein [bacterium]
MTRRVVIGILIILILGVLGGIVALSIFWLQTPTEDIVTTPTIIPITDPTADSDNDGLSNADERVWGTDPADEDTDKDGYIDGVEVQKGHNPTIASPNDKLPPGFAPGQNVAPLDPSSPSVTSFDSYFSESVDVTGGSKNLTEEYARTVPDNDKSAVTLNAFVAIQPINTALPVLDESRISITQDSSPVIISQYLNTAANIESIADKARMTIALNDFFKSKNAYGFTTLAEAIKASQSRIIGLSVPQEALEYQKLLIGYTELLSGTLNQIGAYKDDQLKALVALRQLDAIDRLYFPIISRERERLAGFLE